MYAHMYVSTCIDILISLSLSIYIYIYAYIYIYIYVHTRYIYVLLGADVRGRLEVGVVRGDARGELLDIC